MMSSSSELLYDFVAKLYPINRSITGNGVRETLNLIRDIIPIEIHEVPSGTQVLDWKVPNEWNIREAWIKDSKGETLVDFSDSNLHVLNYSVPIKKKMGLGELLPHLYSNPNQPDWVPYRTSYYNENWGFCLSHNQLKAMRDDEFYEVYIDSSLEPGSLTYGELYIPGNTDDEVLFSVHICHPSLANDNLSAVSVATYLAKELMRKDSHHSARILFIPGTIGSITWLSRNRENTSKIKHGLVLTLLGDEAPFTYKRSREGSTRTDKIVKFLLEQEQEEFEIIDFYPYGYDERQYCSPGFNLPVGRLSRSNHGEFPEYHTSGDNLNFVKGEKLKESLDFLELFFEVVDTDNTYVNKSPFGEPQLGKRGLFDHIGGARSSHEVNMAYLWVLSMSDGSNSLVDIASRSGIDYKLLIDSSARLVETELLELKEK